MTHYLQIIVLGIVEGVTEFLPISSTGHLLIAEKLLGMENVSDIFNVVIQAGAILAVVFIYWHKIVDLFSNLDQREARDYLLKVLLAFATTTVLILVLMVKLKLKLPETLTPVAWATFIGGLVIFAVEAFAKNLYPHEDVSWFEAVLIGAGQVLAGIFPGASRSGSTIMAGLAVGMKRPSVTQFTFLVGIPTMFAASAFSCLKDRKDFHHLGSQLIIDTIIGFFISMVVAFFVVKWLLRFVQSHTFNGFALYRVILGGGLLIGIYTHAIPDAGGDKVKASSQAPSPLVAPATPAPDISTNSDQTAPMTNSDATPVSPVVAPVAPTTNEPVMPQALPVNPAGSTNANIMPVSPGGLKGGTSIAEIENTGSSAQTPATNVIEAGSLTFATPETSTQSAINAGTMIVTPKHKSKAAKLTDTGTSQQSASQPDMNGITTGTGTLAISPVMASPGQTPIPVAQPVTITHRIVNQSSKGGGTVIINEVVSPTQPAVTNVPAAQN